MSERKQIQKGTSYLIAFLSKARDGQTQTESRPAVAGAREGGRANRATALCENVIKLGSGDDCTVRCIRQTTDLYIPEGCDM